MYTYVCHMCPFAYICIFHLHIFFLSGDINFDECLIISNISPGYSLILSDTLNLYHSLEALLGEGNDTLLQYSCQENSIGAGAC